jgi:hypothetical protein
MSSQHAHAIVDVRASTASEESPERYDPYLVIHKALRALTAEALLRLGRLDSEDEQETREVMAQVRQAVTLSESHLKIEETFVHPAMEARAPGSTRRTAHEHVSHAEALAQISSRCDDIERSRGAVRAAGVGCLYRRFAQFVAEDLLHMHAEETENNAVLWATHTDAEILGIVARITASIPPEKNAVYMRWMLLANAPRERLKLLTGLRQGAPPERVAALVESVLPLLPLAERAKLRAALD